MSFFKMPKDKSKLFLWLWVVLLALASDQAGKYLARHNLLPEQVQTVIPGVLNWRLMYNTGAAFSSLAGHTGLLTVVSSLVSGALIFYSLSVIQKASRLKVLALAFLLAGATGNLVDRVLFGKVTDFIDLLLLPGDFPIFNLADIWINLAVVLFIADWAMDLKAQKQLS